VGQENDMVTLGDYLIVSGILFAIGFAGVMVRRNLIIIFMSLELMLNAANLSLAAFSRFHSRSAEFRITTRKFLSSLLSPSPRLRSRLASLSSWRCFARDKRRTSKTSIP